MSDQLEDAIERAMEKLFGDGENADHRQPALCSNPHYLHMLTVAGGQDYDSCELIERHLAKQAEIDGFAASIEKLIEKHRGDIRFEKLCRKAFRARADLTTLEQQSLLNDWEPGLRHFGRPM